MQDGRKLDFDSVTLEGNTLTLKRLGFKGYAIGVEIGGKEFTFRQPTCFSPTVKGFPVFNMIASWLSDGNKEDYFQVTFGL